MSFIVNRLHSAPAAPQSREGGQKPSYFGSEESERADADSAASNLAGTGFSSGTNPSAGDSPLKPQQRIGDIAIEQAKTKNLKSQRFSIFAAEGHFLVTFEDFLYQGEMAAAGRRKGRRRGGGVSMSLQEMDLGAMGYDESEGPSADGDRGALLQEGAPAAKGKNRPARASDHLGGFRHPPRPPDGDQSGNPRNHMLVCVCERERVCVYIYIYI